jgi:hypothetical protein
VHCRVGGRIRLGETLHEAAGRHVRESLGAGLAAAVEPEPYFVNQYFRIERPPYGHDPRKQAVSSCFPAKFAAAVSAAPTGEAEDFQWFPAQALPADLWPGSDRMIKAAIKPPAASLATYEAISDRSLAHNELMWNTPVLAMTAMAFLLTTAPGSGAAWQRAVAASLSLVVALASVQLMAEHSHSQLADSELLHQLEVSLGLPTVHARPKSSLVRRPLTGVLAKGRSPQRLDCRPVPVRARRRRGRRPRGARHRLTTPPRGKSRQRVPVVPRSRLVTPFSAIVVSSAWLGSPVRSLRTRRSREPPTPRGERGGGTPAGPPPPSSVSNSARPMATGRSRLPPVTASRSPGGACLGHKTAPGPF